MRRQLTDTWFAGSFHAMVKKEFLLAAPHDREPSLVLGSSGGWDMTEGGTYTCMMGMDCDGEGWTLSKLRVVSRVTSNYNGRRDMVRHMTLLGHRDPLESTRQRC